MFNTKDTKFSVSFIGLNKLSNIVKVQKDKLAYDSQSGVVYRIDYRDCDTSYVGQMKRQLKTRNIVNN